MHKNTDKQLLLEFSVLEPGDGCTITLVYDGPVTAGIEFDGAILDSPKPKVLPPQSFYSLPRSKRLMESLEMLWLFPIFLVFAGAVYGLIEGLMWLLTKVLGQHTAYKALFAVSLLVLMALVVGAVVNSVRSQVQRLRAAPPFHPASKNESLPHSFLSLE